jgi:hypothetical protein
MHESQLFRLLLSRELSTLAIILLSTFKRVFFNKIFIKHPRDSHELRKVFAQHFLKVL